jgi:Arylsulfotransferase (ASST)
LAVVLAVALFSAFAFSAGALAQMRPAQVAVNGVIGKTSAIRPPRLVVLRRSSRDARGYVFVAPKEGRGSQVGPEVVDDKGRPVWFRRVPYVATDFRVQHYRGNPVLTWWQGIGLGGGEPGVDYIADSSYHVIATVHAANGLEADGHEFVLTPQGTALVTAYHSVPYDLSALGGPKDGTVIEGVVQEIDVATGRVLFEWHSLGHVPLEESYAPVPRDEPYDYFHLNAVNLDNDGNLLISGRATWTVYKVDRQSGQVLWRLGGKRSDFSLGPGARFVGQHDPLPAGENTIRLFDNETTGSRSRVIWIHLDTGTKAATLVKAIEHPLSLSVGAEGNAQALDNGDTFVGWGSSDRVSEFDPQGKLIFDATIPGGNDTYRGYRFQWTGQPDTLPTATAHHRRRKKTIVHAIWNGATGVARWRVLAGRRPAKLSPVRTVAWNGLDTAIKIAGAPKEVRVVALDARGSVIAMSKPIRAR